MYIYWFSSESGYRRRRRRQRRTTVQPLGRHIANDNDDDDYRASHSAHSFICPSVVTPPPQIEIPLHRITLEGSLRVEIGIRRRSNGQSADIRRVLTRRGRRLYASKVYLTTSRKYRPGDLQPD